MSTADGDVSDIDDSEVAGYLNSKEVVRFKRFIWEVLNKDYDQGKSRKRARKAKKAAPAEKTAKPADKELSTSHTANSSASPALSRPSPFSST